MTTTGLTHPTVDAALATAATLLDMEVVLVGSLSETTFTVARVHGDWAGLEEGTTSDRSDSFCHRMLAGAPCHTSDAAHDPDYADAAFRTHLNIRSYVGVPIRASDGRLLGTLCGLDSESVDIDDTTVGVLRELANIVALYMTDELQSAVIRRTPEGWQVGDESADDLLSAMVLADLLSGELERIPRPARADDGSDELTRLRVTVSQLEHALAARITIEQAIGVVAERQRSTPREAFERIRKVARSGGVRIHDLARDVVASTTTPTDLPRELQ
ncbi:MAG: GAF and ANTAR domain-containing protein [Mycobacteriales bacterium]